MRSRSIFRLQTLWRDQPPRPANMKRQVLIANATELNTDPATHTHVRRPEKDLRGFFNEHGLVPWQRWNPHGDMTVVVVVVGKHHKNLFAHEERRFTVRELLNTLWHRRADLPHSPQMFLRHISRWRSGLSFHRSNLQCLALILPQDSVEAEDSG